MVSVVYIELSISTMLTERHVGLNQKRSDLSSERLGGINRLFLLTGPKICLEFLFDVRVSAAVVQFLQVP
jgi:hypothetical protein